MILIKRPDSGFYFRESKNYSSDFALINAASSDMFEFRANVIWNENSRSVVLNPIHITHLSGARTNIEKMTYLYRNISRIETAVREMYKRTKSGNVSRKPITLYISAGEYRRNWFAKHNTTYKIACGYVYKEL